MIGQIVSHYRILEKIGSGGMGEVYKAEDTKLRRTVALKFLPPELTRDSEARERFIQEAQAASALDHPNICTIHEIDQIAEGQIFMVMAYYDGETLEEKIRDREIKVDEAMDIAFQVACGLAKAHGHGIVHRDIKPANVMITHDGAVKILDFGLAKLRGVSKLTKEASTLGTVHYMSPEQALGKEVDPRSDIWSLGVVLYEMLAGRPPFGGDYEQAVVYSILNETPPKIRPQRPEVPPELERIVERCLEKEPDKRYQYANEVTADLRTVQHMGVKTIQLTKRKPKRALWIALGAGLLASLILAVLLLLRPAATKDHAARIQSIAVLPFVDMSPQKDQEYFCDGMTEELINRLSNIQALRVAARTSAFFFKGKTEDIREVGSKLNVRTVLEGSLQKAGDRLRITAQLINVADGFHLWSEKYDRKLEDVFAIQDEISSKIANALKLKLTSREIEKISEHPIDNIKAYEYFLKAARESMRRSFDEKSLDTALAYLQSAKDILGDNAQLYAGMASVYHQYANIGVRQEDYLSKAQEYAKKALTLQPDLASALSILGSLAIYEDYPRNLQDKFRYYQQALAADPNAIGALFGMANTFDTIGRPSKSFAFVKRLERQDPLNQRCYVSRGYSYLYDCQFGKALEQFILFYRSLPESPLAQASYANALVVNGQRDEALTAIDRMGKYAGNNVLIGFSLLLKYALLNDRQSALPLITPDFRKTCWRDLEWSYWVADRLGLLGAREEALDWLENAVHRGFINYPFMQCDPLLNNIRGEERFRKLMKKAKYEWEHFEVPE
jgi:TolB-like protein